MIAYDIDPSLHTREPESPTLDDGFSRRQHAERSEPPQPHPEHAQPNPSHLPVEPEFDPAVPVEPEQPLGSPPRT